MFNEFVLEVNDHLLLTQGLLKLGHLLEQEFGFGGFTVLLNNHDSALFVLGRVAIYPPVNGSGTDLPEFAKLANGELACYELGDFESFEFVAKNASWSNSEFGTFGGFGLFLSHDKLAG